MPSPRSWIGHRGRWLAHSLNRLRQTLDSLGERLQEAVSSAVGQTVAVVVQETVHALLTESSCPSPVAPMPRWTKPQGPHPEPWFDDPGDLPADAADIEDDLPAADGPAASPPASRWPAAALVGLQTTLYGLRRRIGRFPVLSAFGIGLFTAIATYLGGPLAAAGVGLAVSALGLASLAEAVRTGADALAVVSPS